MLPTIYYRLLPAARLREDACAPRFAAKRAAAERSAARAIRCFADPSTQPEMVKQDIAATGKERRRHARYVLQPFRHDDIINRELNARRHEDTLPHMHRPNAQHTFHRRQP